MSARKIRPATLTAILALLALAVVILFLIYLAATRAEAASGKPELVRWETTFRNASFCEDHNALTFEGDIDEPAFAALARTQGWSPTEITGDGVRFLRYSGVIRHDTDRIRPYPEIELPPPESDEAHVTSGLHFSNVQSDGRGVVAIYDRAAGRAYIRSTLR